MKRRSSRSNLKTLHDKSGYDWNKMAIFYRMNALSRVMEDALRKAGVPYQIARGVEFYNRKEIKDAMAYLRIVSNPSDEVSLSRIANVPTRGLSDATLKQISAHAIASGLSLWQAMESAASVPGLSAARSTPPSNLCKWSMPGGPKRTARPRPAMPQADDAPFGDLLSLMSDDEDLGGSDVETDSDHSIHNEDISEAPKPKPKNHRALACARLPSW